MERLVNRRTLPATSLLPLSILAICGAISKGQCDVTFTAEVRVVRDSGSSGSGGGQANSGVQQSTLDVSTATISFKGRSARFESTNGDVRIYDGVKGRLLTLNPLDKTYRIASMKDAWKVADPTLRIPAGADYDYHVTLTKTDTTQSEAGVSTQRYECIASARPSAPEQPRAQGRGAGGRRGNRGGRSPGGIPGGYITDQQPDD